MIFLADADVVLPDRLLSPATVVVDGDRIIDVLRDAPARAPGDLYFDLRRHTIVPGFVDVHVHGVEGTDALDGAHAIARIASRLPRYGVTAFCPTSVACAPEALRTMLGAVRAARFARPAGASRVLPAHLESNFINPQYRGAQPLECLRRPAGPGPEGEFTGEAILDEIAAARPDATAGAGLAPGAQASLGGRTITVRDAAYLDDGTLAGSVLTMNRAFALLVNVMGLSPVDAATVCSTTPARALGLQGFGVITAGAVADLTVLASDLTVTQTWIAGELAFGR